MASSCRLQEELPEVLCREATGAGWVVLAGALPEELRLELIAAVCSSATPLLVVEPDPLRLMQLRQALGAEGLKGVSLAAELLAAEPGEQCWYRYNDPRHSGTTPPELLQALLPNLQLESLELRPTRPLALLLEQWQPQGGEQALLEGDGVVLVGGDGAAAVLAGAGPWLQRLGAVLVAAEAPGAAELEALLAAAALALENAGPGLQLWRRSPQLLLQRQLDQLVGELDQLVGERDQLVGERDGLLTERLRLVTERDQLAFERDQLTAERNQQSAERDRLAAERDGLLHQRDQLAAERDQLVVERDGLLTERVRLVTERDQLAFERDQLTDERNQQSAERDRLAAERDGLLHQRDQLAAERDQIAAQKQELEQRLAQVNTELDEILAVLKDAESESIPEPEAPAEPEPPHEPGDQPGC